MQAAATTAESMSKLTEDSETAPSSRGATPARDARRKLALGIVLVYACLLFASTHWPRLKLPKLPADIPVDKILHFTAYTILTLLLLTLPTGLFRLPEGGFRRSAWFVAACVVLAIATAGMLDELTQPLVGRDFEMMDWAFDVAGCLTALMLVTLYLSVQYPIVRLWRRARGTAARGDYSSLRRN